MLDKLLKCNSDLNGLINYTKIHVACTYNSNNMHRVVVSPSDTNAVDQSKPTLLWSRDSDHKTNCS